MMAGTPSDLSCPRRSAGRPVQTSAVYLVGAAQFPSEPPLSPPSPITPEEPELGGPIEELSLGAPALGQSDPIEHQAAIAAADRLAGAVHVLATEAMALQKVTQLYATNRVARDGFNKAVEAIIRAQTQSPQGKLVIIGVGKSGHIGRKLTATFNSLDVQASFLHPTEALHGDMGHIRPHDVLLLVTYSGKTAELLNLLPHLAARTPHMPVILLTAHASRETCELVRRRPEATILLPAPVHEEESVSFGVQAPTTSTTTALAVGDALAIVTSKELHRAVSVSSVFLRNHPGGAIGEDAAAAAVRKGVAASQPSTVGELAVPWAELPVVATGPSHDTTNPTQESPVQSAPLAADVLRAGYDSPSGWVRVGPDGVAPPRRIRALQSTDWTRCVHELPELVVPRRDFLALCADTNVRTAVDWLRGVMAEPGVDGEAPGLDGVVGVVRRGEVVGVLEIERLLAFEGT